MAIVDTADGLVAGAPLAARQCQYRRGPEMADDAVVEEVHLQARADRREGTV